MNPGRQAAGTDRNIARQRRFWTRRAASWDHGAGNNPGLLKVVERVLAEADPSPEASAVDLGCGSGQVTLALAKRCRTVLGVDVSEQMIALLLENAERQGVSNVKGRAVPIERLGLSENSVDLVVSELRPAPSAGQGQAGRRQRSLQMASSGRPARRG